MLTSPCYNQVGGSDILLCYQCDAKVSTTNAMSTAMQLMHDHSSCSCISHFPDSSTTAKLYPNLELSPADKAHVSHSLSDLQHLFDRHNFELARLRDVITFLSTSQEALARRMEDVRSLVAPINALPDEVLAEILRMHFSTQMEEIKYRSYGRIRIPLGFTRVCKRWRGVALETPSIWADVTAFGDMHVPANGELNEAIFVRDLMKMFLARSKHASLKVKLGLSTSQVATKSSSRIVAPLLLAQSTRWGEAEIDVDLEGDDLNEHEGDMGYTITRLNGSFPLMKRLAIGGKFASSSQRWRWQDLPDANHSPPPAIVLRNAPLLTHLTLNLRASLSPAEMARAIDIPWHQIRTLKCNYSFGNLESLLRLCTNVEEVEVSAIFRAKPFHNVHQAHEPNPMDIGTQEEDTYTCKSLKRMSLNVALPSCTGVKGLLRHLRAPRLTYLDLTFIPSSSDSFLPHATLFPPTSISTFLSDDLVSFFSRSHGPCQLTDLVLRDIPKFQSCAETLVTLFGNLPELRKLQLGFRKTSSNSDKFGLDDFDLDDVDMEQDSCSLVNFFNELRSTPILPALKSFKIENLADAKSSSAMNNHRNLETEALFDMLETRREAVAIGLSSSSIVTQLEVMQLDEELVSLVL
ncbi:hypothetical protein F5878DRAFT_86310 [Lentinula raphanica]|uniref:F-box domain-containing protein n=1 Tax=Lentinula raphanica TaxID=153919 RepID=A0AA38UMV5_9AGAR|nr:hypothetical protein F5878DRAFT_86310 [Lentinula raphanica]